MVPMHVSYSNRLCSSADHERESKRERTCAHVVDANFSVLVRSKHNRHRWVHSDLGIKTYTQSVSQSVRCSSRAASAGCSISPYLVDLSFATERVKVARTEHLNELLAVKVVLTHTA